MRVINARNVNEAYQLGVAIILSTGAVSPSRNGEVLVAPGPVMSIYYRPCERVLFDANRDANPYFHLMEAIWMLAGEKAAEWPVKFNKQIAEYANDDGKYDGAYGYRWRRHFGFDQIQWAVTHLRNDPMSRRCVIGMYDPTQDMNTLSKDVPCNTHLYLDCRGRKLNMTICNRSNDAVWGAYGANAVHFSALMEVIAAGLDIPVGEMRQFSNNLHIYKDIPKVWEAVTNPAPRNPYLNHRVQPWPMVKDYPSFLGECNLFLSRPVEQFNYHNPFFYYVARPMYLSWEAYKAGEMADAISCAQQIEASDWSLACVEWLSRRGK
jgi:hypothetical protein